MTAFVPNDFVSHNEVTVLTGPKYGCCFLVVAKNNAFVVGQSISLNV